MEVIFIGSTLLILLVTVLPLSRHPHWIIRSMDFPRLQITCLAVVLLFFLFFFAELHKTTFWILIAVTAICLIWQLWWILPYTPLWPKEVLDDEVGVPETNISFITSNVLTTNKNSGALIKLVEKYKPDILVTLESDQWWEEQLEVLEEAMPHSVKCPLDNLYGMHVYSRLPLHDAKISFLVEDDIPSVHACAELRNGQKVQLHLLHPAPPSPTENEESAERDAELIMVAKMVSTCDQPVIVTGDLNDVAWSSTTRLFRKISGLLDPRVGRGLFNTFHAHYRLLRWPLDHIFHSNHFTLRQIERLPSIDSDHFPLYTALSFSPAQGEQQQGLEDDTEDHERAEELMEEQGVSEEDVPQSK
ncbi:endonuclease/exonuclease/phosphatase family protein [Zeaxanthinibacter sp. PT1]|uniref:endonuclease/exonuclease/phosphatase family protein n=1 Tax=Zeaxanthinibacter TaxID=561554 RepID=UPI00234AADAB|nr:endonuclease/exonuclease/phosphatase family protein [Zeaxanthinibacter sp. PT1]MDC6350103.1 endonuclease/exonuclease/phosphatase family protein [Zeaxanthinibacter sp. PT1]